MSRKFWTLRPNAFCSKPNQNGHRNEIAWTALGCVAFFWLWTKNWKVTPDPTNTFQQKQGNSTWF